MLKKSHRLPAGQRLKNPIFQNTTYFLLKYSKNKKEVSRFAFVIKKSVEKTAVGRNRARRVLRSCVEETLGEIKTGYDMIFFIQKGIIGKKQEEVCDLLKKQMLKNNLIK